jgi:ABC-type transporter Mla subunit MlaD
MVVLGLIVTFAVYRYVDERSSTDAGYGVYAYFDDVQGLVAKSRVLVAGIPVGYISSIRLDGTRARVDRGAYRCWGSAFWSLIPAHRACP